MASDEQRHTRFSRAEKQNENESDRMTLN